MGSCRRCRWARTRGARCLVWFCGARADAHVRMRAMPNARSHPDPLVRPFASAHADGRGAVNLTPAGAKSGGLVYGLRPALKLYFWVTYQDAAGKMSKPSAAREAVLVDTFKEK